MKLSPRSIIAVASAVSVLEIAGGAWLFWTIAASVVDERQRIVELQTRIDGFEHDRAFASEFSSLRQSRQTDIARIETFFPDRDRPIAFLEALDLVGTSAAQKSAVDLDEQGGDAEHLAFRVTVSGTLTELRRYLHAITLMPYDIAIKELAYQHQVVAPSSGVPAPPDQLRISILIRTR